MKTYKVALTRTYFVSIQAENQEQAERFSEYYLGDCPDRSKEKDQKDKNFLIEEIEMVYNEANEIITVTEEYENEN